jgi:hypothetical protein
MSLPFAAIAMQYNNNLNKATMVPPAVTVECHASVDSAASVEKDARSLADAIRHDRDLLFADDAPPPPADPGERCQWPRPSSQHDMARLQQEVDRALEIFAREADCGDKPREGKQDAGYLGASSATTIAESVATDDDPDFGECYARLLSFSEPASPEPASEPRPLRHKTRSLLSLPLSLLPSRAATERAAEEAGAALRFEEALANELDGLSITEERIQQRGLDFDAFPSLRSAMEPFLSVARESCCCVVLAWLSLS